MINGADLEECVLGRCPPGFPASDTVVVVIRIAIERDGDCHARNRVLQQSRRDGERSQPE